MHDSGKIWIFFLGLSNFFSSISGKKKNNDQIIRYNPIMQLPARGFNKNWENLFTEKLKFLKIEINWWSFLEIDIIMKEIYKRISFYKTSKSISPIILVRILIDMDMKQIQSKCATRFITDWAEI